MEISVICYDGKKICLNRVVKADLSIDEIVSWLDWMEGKR